MNAVGIDMGGTRIRVLLVDRDGRVVARDDAPTRATLGAEAAIGTVIRLIGSVAASAAKGSGPAAIGLGMSGPIDVRTGIVSNPFTLDGWPPTDIRSPLEQAFGVPVVVENDANAAALGEWWLGAGRGARRLAMVTVGTGIGVGLLVDGHVQRAVDGRHGEAGHLIIDPRGPACYCGARGCWEVLASGSALERKARSQRWAVERVARIGADLARIDGRFVFEAATDGDVGATLLIEETAQLLGLGLVSLVSVFTPDLIVLSGGVAVQLDRLLPRISEVLRQHNVMIPTGVPILGASAGDDTGAIGAARLAFDSLGAFGAEEDGDIPMSVR